MNGNGGYWNRAGRRSGGARPIDLSASPEISCACGTTTAFGLMPQRILGGMAVRCCPGCEGVLLAEVDGRWLTAEEALRRRG